MNRSARAVTEFAHQYRRFHLSHHPVVIIGAGPYGLVLSACFRVAGVNVAVFGKPMSFWSENVPAGTRLLSGPVICSFSGHPFDCAGYARSSSIGLPVAFTRDEFLSYGLWFQRAACPPVDTRQVIQIARGDSTFVLRLDDGELATADHVVIATGLKPFASVPQQFTDLEKPSILHTSDLSDLGCFAGRDLVLVGAGQSAIDCAALLSEAGAKVELLSRAPKIRRRGSFSPAHVQSRPLAPGRRRLNIRKLGLEVFNNPPAYRRLPGPVRLWGLHRVLQPAADPMRQPRLRDVRITLGQTAVQAVQCGSKVRLQLVDSSIREVNHVILGTGYRVDVEALTFLARELRQQIRTRAGFPQLNGTMESNVPGLFYIGASSAWCFGPVMWLVRGCVWTAQKVCSAVLNLKQVKREAVPKVLAASGE